MLTSYLKSVAAGPQQLQLKVKKAKRGQSGGEKKVSPLFEQSPSAASFFDGFK
jgi:hypothetical protein